MNTFKAYILASDKVFYEGDLESLVVPTVSGLYGVWANHRPMISAVVPGIITYRAPFENDKIAAVSGGLVKIENNEVLVLVDSIELPEEIDINRAKRARDEAKEALLQKKSIEEYRQAKANLARAINRLKVKRVAK